MPASALCPRLLLDLPHRAWFRLKAAFKEEMEEHRLWTWWAVNFTDIEEVLVVESRVG